MNKYLMRIKGYFSGWNHFEIEANNKQDAIIKAKDYCKNNSKYSGGNFIFDSIECVKKLKR
jgi:hypothetical protein